MALWWLTFEESRTAGYFAQFVIHALFLVSILLSSDNLRIEASTSFRVTYTFSVIVLSLILVGSLMAAIGQNRYVNKNLVEQMFLLCIWIIVFVDNTHRAATETVFGLTALLLFDIVITTQIVRALEGRLRRSDEYAMVLTVIKLYLWVILITFYLVPTYKQRLFVEETTGVFLALFTVIATTSFAVSSSYRP